MKILMISTDPGILDPHSSVSDRMRFYASALDELHIVVVANGALSEPVRGNLFVYNALGSFFIRSVRAVCEMRRIIRDRFIDVVSVQSPDELGLLMYFATRNCRVPFQVQVHTDVMSTHWRHASWKEQIRAMIADFLISRATCVRAASNRIAESLIRAGRVLPGRITILPVFTDIERAIGATPDPAAVERFRGHSFKMLAGGRFVEKEKNFLLLIDMMLQLVQLYPDALLVIAGNGRDKERYVHRIRAYGLEKNVILHEWVSNLPSFIAAFDAFCISSHYEGWGVVALEAMAVGVPVVMTDVGLAGELIKNGENGLVVPVGNTQAFGAAVASLAKDPVMRRRIGENGRARVMAYTLLLKRDEYLRHLRQSFVNCISSS